MAVVMLMLLRVLHQRKYQLDAIFVISVFLGSKSCPSSMDIIGLPVSTRNPRDFPVLHVSTSFKNCSSATCATVTVSACSDLDVFRRQIITLSHTLYYNYFNTTRCPQVLRKYSFVCFGLVRCAVSVIVHLDVGSARYIQELN